jgi:hypothetical protein
MEDRHADAIIHQLFHELMNKHGKGFRIMDAGAGVGTWGRILQGWTMRPHVQVVALEIHEEPGDVYDEVIQADLMEFGDWDRFDALILGDVLPCLDRERGLRLIQRLRKSKAAVFASHPITPCPSPEDSNPFNRQLDQWTGSQMLENGWQELHAAPTEDRSHVVGSYRLKNRVVSIRGPRTPREVWVDYDQCAETAAVWARRWLGYPDSFTELERCGINLAAKATLEENGVSLLEELELYEVAGSV